MLIAALEASGSPVRQEAMGDCGGEGSIGVGGAWTLGVLRLRLRMTPLLKKVTRARTRARASASARARTRAKAKARAEAEAKAKATAIATATATATANAGILHCVQNDGIGWGEGLW
jgi:hypothetical protein